MPYNIIVQDKVLKAAKHENFITHTTSDVLLAVVLILAPWVMLLLGITWSA
jgi:hypothetical protein